MAENSPSVAQRAHRGDSKEAAVLAAAFCTFASYGFRRSSMEDIANAANVSRTALYHYFKNKEDVFRAIIELFYMSANDRVATALETSGSIADVLNAALAAYDGEELAATMNSSHGAELLETKSATSGEIGQIGELAIRAKITAWLEQKIANGEADLRDINASATDVVADLIAAKNGLKNKDFVFDDYVAGRDRLARIFGKALQK